jgi:hypothetical protein
MKKALVHDALHSILIRNRGLSLRNPRTDYPLPLEATLSPSQSSPYPNQQWNLNGSEGHWNIRTKHPPPTTLTVTPTPLKKRHKKQNGRLIINNPFKKFHVTNRHLLLSPFSP